MTNSPNTTNPVNENDVSRRSVVTKGVVTAAALAAGSTAALALPAEDAELKLLWAQWLEQFRQVCVALRAQTSADEAYLAKLLPRPKVERHVCGNSEHGWFIRERRSDVPMPFPDPDERIIQCPSANSWEEAHEIGQELAAAEKTAYDQAEFAARKFHGVDESEAASDAEWDKLADIERAMKQAQPEGLFGIGAKLAIWKHFAFTPAEDSSCEQCAASAYDDIARLVDVDFEAMIWAIERVHA